MKKETIKKPSKRLGILIAIVSFALFATIVTLISKAATPTASIEVGSASTVTAPATVITDATASGGNAVQFKTAPVVPPGSSRCPAYPSFPDASCTGVIPGSTLTSCNGNLQTANATYTNCLFSSGVVLFTAAKNVKITNSRILGTVSANNPNFYGAGLVMTDVEIDGRNSGADGIGGIMGYTCIRCNVHDASKGFAGGNFRVEDSYVHDIWGVRSCSQFPGDCQSHNEAVLPFDGDNNILLHNNLDSNYSPASNGGGMSAAIALYTHSDFWGGINNVLIEKNRIANAESPYCAYLGNTTDPDGDPSNLRLIDNVFVSCNTFLGWLRGNGNVWTNNRFTSTSGTVISEPSSSNYQ